jgi:hypothetical protein
MNGNTSEADIWHYIWGNDSFSCKKAYLNLQGSKPTLIYSNDYGNQRSKQAQILFLASPER